MITLEQIIKECRQYNKFAQKLLYEKYAPVMKGICMRYIGDSDAVKDVVQEGFIKVFSGIKQYKGEGSFDGWIKRIFINTSITHIRKQKNKRFLKIEEIHESDIVNDYSGDERLEPNKDLKKVDFQLVLSADFSETELLKVLENLPDKYRLVFNLFCIENFKHEEIASMLNIDVATSRTRLMRARALVQRELYEMSIVKLSSSN